MRAPTCTVRVFVRVSVRVLVRVLVRVRVCACVRVCALDWGYLRRDPVSCREW